MKGLNIKNLLKKGSVGVLVLTMTIQPMVQAAPREAIEAFKKAPIVESRLQTFNKEIKIYMIQNGEKTRIDTKLKDGIRVLNERTSVGVRDLAELIPGTRVEWDGANQVVDIYAGEKNIAFPLNKKIMYDGRKVKELDTQAAVDYAIERTFLPIRTIAEALGYTVDWDAKESAVLLVAPGETVVNTTQPTENKDPNRPKNAQGYYTTNKTGQKLPTLEEAQERHQTPNFYFCLNEYVSKEDFEVLPNGNILMLGGTEFATEFHGPFKKVSSSPANPNFKVLEPNPNDSRVGTYVYGKGSTFWNKGEYKAADFLTKLEGYRKADYRKVKYSKELMDVLEPREIKDKKIALMLHNFRQGLALDDQTYSYNAETGDIRVFDATGLFDSRFQTTIVTYVPDMALGYHFYITDKGELRKTNETKGSKVDYPMIQPGEVIDKIVTPLGTGTGYLFYYVVTDIPNVTYHYNGTMINYINEHKED